MARTHLLCRAGESQWPYAHLPVRGGSRGSSHGLDFAFGFVHPTSLRCRWWCALHPGVKRCGYVWWRMKSAGQNAWYRCPCSKPPDGLRAAASAGPMRSSKRCKLRGRSSDLTRILQPSENIFHRRPFLRGRMTSASTVGLGAGERVALWVCWATMCCVNQRHLAEIADTGAFWNAKKNCGSSE